MTSFEESKELYRKKFGRLPEWIVRCPGKKTFEFNFAALNTGIEWSDQGQNPWNFEIEKFGNPGLTEFIGSGIFEIGGSARNYRIRNLVSR